jgi:hypothetical protein
MSAALAFLGLDSLPVTKKPCSSGAMKPKVPFKVGDKVKLSSARLLMPESPIFTHQSSGGFDFTRMFWSRK